jgi:hypothetical protein
MDDLSSQSSQIFSDVCLDDGPALKKPHLSSDTVLLDDISDAASECGDDLSMLSSQESAVVIPRVHAVDSLPELSRRGEGLQLYNRSRAKSSSSTASVLGLAGHDRKVYRQQQKNQLKKSDTVVRQLCRTQAALSATGQAWNRNKLRVGDKLDSDHALRKRHGGRPQHPAAWSVHGTIALSFARIGALSQRENRDTKRPLDAISVVSLASSQHQCAAVKTRLSSLPHLEGGAPEWVFVGRSNDCTPLRMAFGLLRPLADVARYWHRQTGAPAQLLNTSEMLAKVGKLPSCGIVEMLAQTGCLAWPQQHGEFCAVERRDLLFPPCFVERTNGSTIFAAVEGADPSLDIEKLIGLTFTVSFVVVFLGSDLASSCQRMKQEYARRIQAHNFIADSIGAGVILLMDGPCVAHVLHREVEHAFDTHKLIPRLYATAWSVSLPSVYSHIVSSLQRIVEDDLAVGFFPGVAPPSRVAQDHSEVLAKMTIMRYTHARGTWEDGDAASDTSVALFEDFKRLLNGDLRAPRIEHYCHSPGCCDGHQRAAAVKAIVILLLECFFNSMGVDLPAESRWYTFSPHLARQCGAFFTHRILGRVLSKAYTFDPQDSNGNYITVFGHTDCDRRLSVCVCMCVWCV